MVAQKAYVFAQQRPDTGKVGYIDSDRGLSSIPEHVGCVVDVGEVVNFGQDGSDDLFIVSVGT